MVNPTSFSHKENDLTFGDTMDEDFGYEYDEGSDIDNWEDEQVFQDGVLDRQSGCQEDAMDTYGEDAFCRWCREDDGIDVIGEPIGSEYMGDILLCPDCGHEWVAIPHAGN